MGGLTERTKKDYISVLDKRIPEALKPNDLEKIEINKGLALALRNFMKFLEDRDIDSINGYNIDKWRMKIVIPKA